MRRVLVAGVGNVLRADDGVGPRVADLLRSRPMPDGVVVEEFGTGGIHLVQALMETRYDGLVVVDCVDRDRAPGVVMVIRPEVLDVGGLRPIARFDFLADMHYTKPERAFALAKALGVLPADFALVGVQPVDADSLREGLTPTVAAAAELAAETALEVACSMVEGAWNPTG